jgi:hypothetical protein
MLRAYYNMPAADFIAQLRTYVIAMGLGPQVVDAVDNLTGIDYIEGERAAAIQQAEDDARVLLKQEILYTVGKWAPTSLDEETMKQLLAVIEEV